MKLTVIAHVWNEAFLMPYWLRHHYPMFDHGVILDYGSTDGTPDMVRELAPGWELRRSRNSLFDARLADLEVMEVERECEGWKMTLNATEFVYHHDLRGFSRWMELYRPDVQGLWAKDFVMVDRPQDADDFLSDEPLHCQKRFGYPGGGSRSRLLHRCPDGRYEVGRHASEVVGKALDDEIVVAWFGWCPIKSVWRRKLAIQRMIPESDKQLGLGSQHDVTEESLRTMYEDEVSKCVDLVEACPRYAEIMDDLRRPGVLNPCSPVERAGAAKPRMPSMKQATAWHPPPDASRVDVSVVIPACNGAPFIARTLRSVLSQTVLPSEVIVVDDASTDDMPDLVRWLAKTSPIPLRLLRLDKRSGGPSRPLNVGIGAAVSPVIATLDHDDIMLPDKLDRQWNCLQQCPRVGLVAARVRVVGRVLGGERDLDAEQAFERLRRGALDGSCYRIAAKDAYETLARHGCFWLSSSNLVFRKSVYEACGGFDERLFLNADYAFVEKVARCHDVGFVDEVLLEWRLRPEGLYRTSAAWLKSAETLSVLRRVDRRRLSDEGRKLASRRLRSERSRFVLHYWERCRASVIRRLT